MMGKGAKAGAMLFWASAFTAAVAGSAFAQGSTNPSDLAVSRLMGYAWALTPDRFTTAEAKTIVVDKTKPANVMITREAAVEVIRGGYRTYEADLCGLTEEGVANVKALMTRVKAKYSLTEQQYLYANQLHMATLQYSKGGLKITGEDENKRVELLTIPERDPKECTDERRKRVQAAVAAYIKQEPGLKASTEPPGKRAEPTPTSQKK